MFIKRDKYVLLFSMVLFVASFLIGYFIMDAKFNPDNKILANEPTEEGAPDIEIIREENRISPNTFIEERVHYKECGHLTTNAKLAGEDIISMTKEELIEHINNNNSNMQLISFSNVKVVLWGEKNHLCQEHYIIGEENGKIAIFTIDEDGNRVLDKVFVEYPINVLRQGDQDKLMEGIIVNSEDELSDILENYIS